LYVKNDEDVRLDETSIGGNVASATAGLRRAARLNG